MESTMLLIFLVVFLKVISAQLSSLLELEQEITALRTLLPRLSSPQCQLKPEYSIQCCKIPELFDRATYVGCITPDNEKFGKPAARGSPECAEKKCVLRNNDLLLDNDEIDKDAFKQYLNEWVATRRDYMPAVKAVKDVCLGNKPLLGSMLMCDSDRLQLCIASNFLNKCPDWLDTDKCTTAREFIENCMPYFDKDVPK